MEHKTIKKLVFYMLVILLSSSCYYDSEEDLYPMVGCDIQDMSYSLDIIPIIEANCYVCHDSKNNFGNVTMDSYSDIKVHVDSGRLLGAIKHMSGFAFMPQNAPMLIECNIEKIESWISDGAPNN
jgi:hypothetical protein